MEDFRQDIHASASAVEPPAPPPPSGPRLRTAIGAIALYFLIQFGVALLAGMVFALAHAVSGDTESIQEWMRHPDINAALILVTLPVACMLSILIFRRGYRDSWTERGSKGIGIAPIRGTQFSAQVLLGLGAALIGGMITYLLMQGKPIDQDISMIMLKVSLPMRLSLGLVIITLVPLAEEILFRGILLPALIRHMSVPLAVGIDACLFAAIHLPDLGWKPQGLVALALVGALCCWRRLKTGSVYSAVAVHAGNNLLVMAMLAAAH